MGKDIVRAEIDGQEYEFLQLGAKKGLRLATRVSKMLSGPMAKAATSVGSSGNLLDLDVDVIGEAVKELAGNLDEDENERTVEMLFEVINHKGRKVSWEHPNFEGKVMHLCKVIGKAMVVNLGDFFDEIKGVAGKFGAAKGSTPAKPTLAATGSSGG